MWDTIWFIVSITILVGVFWMLARAMRGAQHGGRGYSSNDSRSTDVWWGGFYGPDVDHYHADTSGAGGGDGGGGDGTHH
jgi:hypothetical protein